MKKRMFLSTILMTLVLVVALTTATFAWYQATAGTVGYGSADDATISTAANSYASGDFTVNVEFGVPSGAPVLTNTLGQTYYYAGEVSGAEILDGTAGPKSGSVAFTVTVTYGGTGLSDEEIADLWSQMGENVQVVITDGSEGLGAGAGLKFWKDAAHQTEWVDGAATLTYTFNLAAVSFTSGTGQIGTGTVYYGAKGVDDLAQSPSDAYKMVATASQAA